MTIIDTHTHLYDLPDQTKALQAAAASGVTDVVALGADLASNKKHIDLKKSVILRPEGPKDLKIHLAFALHPGNLTASEGSEACLAFIREHVSEAVAIGECGLDFHYKWVKDDEIKKSEQRDVFARQLSLAKEFNLPVVIHSRGACRESLDMAIAAGIAKANFHWYSGPVDVLKDILDRGFLVSVSPSLEYSPETKEVARFVPLDRLLVETDTPVRGWTPIDVWRTLKMLAAIKGKTEEEVSSVVNANARTFFNIPVL